MKNVMFAWLATASVFIVFAGCSTNKTGSNFSLAQVNPFRWIKPESQDKPYPQKPSAFATPGGVPGEQPQDALASANAKSGGTLYPTPSTQVYPGSSTDYQASLGSQYPATASQTSITATAPQGIQPQTRPYDPTRLASAAPQGNGRQVSWNTSNAGLANAGDAASSSQYPGQYPATSSPAYPVPRSAEASLAGGGASTASAAGNMSSAAPQYNLAGSRYQIGAPTAAGQVNAPASANAMAATTGSTSSPSGANADWSALVGDRYAQVYQQNPQPVWQSNGTPVGNTGYTPGNTGYIPGASGTPPGSTDYRPGQTGYNPPGLNNEASSTSLPDGNSKNQNVTTPGEYRPGSTKSYVPRSDLQSTNQTWDSQQTSATVPAAYATTPYSSQPVPATLGQSTNTQATTTSPFRL